MSGDLIRIDASDGAGFGAWLTRPRAGSGPAIALALDNGAGGAAPEIAALYAAEGYVVLCPQPAAEDALTAAIAALYSRPECCGKIAALGFGAGALPALRAAAAGRVEAAVCYSPADVGGAVRDLAARTARPVALHLAERDPGLSPAMLARLEAVAAGNPAVSVYVYPGAAPGFEEKGGAHYDRAVAGLAHSRSVALLRQTIGPYYDLEALWEAHTRYEFAARDVVATMATMVDEPYVNHVPVMTGGVGARDLARFYANHFIPKCPQDIALTPVSRTVGADRVVDEMVLSFTHDIEIDWMLPGVPPTGRRVEVPLVAIVGFRGDKLYHEHIYWDQASVLVQIGLLDPEGLPVAGVATAKKLLDETLPSNTLMKRWADSAPKAG